MTASPFWISLQVAFFSTLITFCAGILAAVLTMRLSKGKNILDGLLTMPLVLPPTVMGFFLLLLFGKNGFFGALLLRIEYNIIFTMSGAVLAAAAVSFPLMYRTVRGALEAFDQDLISAARTLGMSEGKIIRRIVLPNIKSSVLAGTVLSFARAMGDFGATIMVAGNIPGRTQTMSLAVYTAVQAGNREAAVLWSSVICAISLLIICLLNRWQGQTARR